MPVRSAAHGASLDPARLPVQGRVPPGHFDGAEGAVTLTSTSFLPPPKKVPRKKTSTTSTTIRKITTIATTPVLGVTVQVFLDVPG